MLGGNLAMPMIIFGFLVFAHNAGVLKNIKQVFFKDSKEA